LASGLAHGHAEQIGFLSLRAGVASHPVRQVADGWEFAPGQGGHAKRITADSFF